MDAEEVDYFTAAINVRFGMAVVDTMNSALGDDVATKADIAGVKSDIRLLQSPIGFMHALQLAILIKLFMR